MQPITITDKIANSLINCGVVIIVFIFLLPFLNLPTLHKQILIVMLFLVYKLMFMLFNKNRTLGMIITKTYWKKEYPFWKQLLHTILYTASFSTLIFWIFFPFDVLIANIIILQLPQ